MDMQLEAQLKDNRAELRRQPAIERLLEKMPDDVTESFSEKQLSHLLVAVAAREWGKHTVDWRGTFKIPFIKKRFYYVMLFGKNSRHLTRREKQIGLWVSTGVISVFLMFATLLGLLVLYLIKSAFGINIFEGFSLGIWSWFKGLWA